MNYNLQLAAIFVVSSCNLNFYLKSHPPRVSLVVQGQRERLETWVLLGKREQLADKESRGRKAEGCVGVLNTTMH